MMGWKIRILHYKSFQLIAKPNSENTESVEPAISINCDFDALNVEMVYLQHENQYNTFE